MARNSKLAMYISLIYCCSSAVWIYLSDRMLPIFAQTPSAITFLATFKGFIFVAVTSFILYLVIRYLDKGRCSRCRSILETIDDAVIIIDPDTECLVDVNSKACELFKLNRQEILAHAPNKISSAGIENSNNSPAWIRKTRTAGDGQFECMVEGTGGKEVWLDIRFQTVDINGLQRTVAVARDVSERKASENSLRRLNRTLKTLLACNEVLTHAHSEDELFNNICKTIVEDGSYRFAWVGLAEHDENKSIRLAAHAGFILGATTMMETTWDNAEQGRGPAATAIREKLPCLLENNTSDVHFIPVRDEIVHDYSVTVLSIPLIHDNCVLGALTVGTAESGAINDEEMNLMIQLADDMAYGIASLKTAADRKRMEEALVKSESNLAESQSIASLGSWEYDLVADEEFRSDEFFRILGLEPSANGKAHDSVFDYIHSDDREHVLRQITETLEEGKRYDVEYRIKRTDGSERILHAQGRTQLDAAGNPKKFIGTVFDITERKKADTALRNSEIRFRSLVETTTDWIWEIDENSTYVYSSPKIRELLGYEPEEVIGKTPFDLMHPQETQRLAQIFTSFLDERKPFSSLENINIHKNGTLVTIETSGMPIFDESGIFRGYRGIDRDVTDRKKLEEKFLQSQKMEAVGQLAGGIAHDFNNILTAIIGFQHLLFDHVKGEKPRYYAKQVLSLADKASNLTNELLAFSRKQTIFPKQADVNDALKNIGKILKRLIGEDIDLQLNLHDGPLQVMAVAGRMEQVFMNLATNARDAMPNGGLLTIKTEIIDIDSSFVQMYRHGEAGTYALISFSDTGVGMDEATRLRVFEPFFTTKEVGKGTGLGLSTVYGIVHQHEGFINVYSEPGEGTTFRIYLPLVAQEKTEEFDTKCLLLPPRGSEAVLIVEDEPEVRQVMSTLLEKSGYQVITAIDGEHALEQFLEYDAFIDLIILDVIMPKKNGKEVFEIISKTRKDIKTIFVSGYTSDIIEQKGIPENCHLISKPFSPDAFLWKVRDVLDETCCGHA